MTLYESVADLPLVVDGSDRSRHERDTSSDFLRKTTVFNLHGEGEIGHGEDVTYDTEDHDALADEPDDLFADAGLTGEYTFDEFSTALDDVELFPTREPDREASRHYRRWAVESAGLDLALRQAGENLGSVLGRDYRPVNFVASTRLGDPPTMARIDAMRERNPDVTFKLDPTSDWDEELVADLARSGVVRILDLKGHYMGTTVDQEADPDLYERVFGEFPDAVVEDPAITATTDHIVEENADRISWDAPITDVESVDSLPFEPKWLNVKPSRFGTVEALFDTIDYADAREISLYGGGQFELGVGRDHLHAIASLCYPDGPNDVAPGVYNDPELPDELPPSPLEPSETPDGMGFRES